jgi:hypothetical protein
VERRGFLKPEGIWRCFMKGEFRITRGIPANAWWTRFKCLVQNEGMKHGYARVSTDDQTTACNALR